MFEKLRGIKERYDFLSDELSKSEVFADPVLYAKYSKERAELGETAEAYESYLAMEKEMTGAFAAADEE